MMRDRGLLTVAISDRKWNFLRSSLLFPAFGENDIKIELSSPDWSTWKMTLNGKS